MNTTTATTSDQVAATILAQLGGQRFKVMTGAKDFSYGANHLTFRIPGTITKDRINCVRIRLNAMDLYDVEFMVIRGVKIRTVRSLEGVYAESLREVFTAETGLDTHL